MTASTIAINDLTGSNAGAFCDAETADTLEASLGNRVLVLGYRRVILAFHISGATTNDKISITAGDNPPAFRAGIGALVWTSAAGGAAEVVLGPLETARFIDTDGYINMTFPTHVSLAGTIEAFGVD